MTTTEAILVPVLNEEAAIGPVLAELAPHAVGRRVYLLDGGSHDRTVAEAQCRARDCGLDLAVIDCPPGLATAIRSGFEQVPEEHLAVIDGDGQHEPKILDTLFQDLRDGRDLAVGSRYVANASIPRDWPRHRYAGSVVLLWLACTTVRCHGIRDPFAGCFAVRREAWERVAGRFETGGYKFLLDFLAASPGLRVAERPVEYRARRAGASKMSFAVFWELLVSIGSGVLRAAVPRRWISFGGAGVLGAGVAAAAHAAGTPWPAAWTTGVAGSVVVLFLAAPRCAERLRPIDASSGIRSPNGLRRRSMGGTGEADGEEVRPAPAPGQDPAGGLSPPAPVPEEAGCSNGARPDPRNTSAGG